VENICLPTRIRTDARLVDSGDGKWAFSGEFREAPIDLSGVDFIKQTPAQRRFGSIFAFRLETGNPRDKPGFLWRLFTDSTTTCSGPGRERLVPEKSLFRTAQPRKLGVEEGAGLGSGFAWRYPS
jgi:hypothetical protein